VLAAVERAERHRSGEIAEVPIWAVVQHLGIPRHSAPARGVRVQLDHLLAVGSLECSRRHGVLTWRLTNKGRRRLRATRASGQPPQLPESPQHLAWRRARTAAEREIGRFREELGESLDEAIRLLHADPPTHSDAWFELGQRLGQRCRRLGSASHCLYEWSEPQDRRADVDEHTEPGDERLDAAEQLRRRARRGGRRNTRLWGEGA